jgi:uncharacterized protein YdeI (YjbR/CyaY-like superfamily)
MTPAKPQSGSKPIRFRAKLESGILAQDHSENRYWTAVRVPFHPAEVWPVRRGMSVRGTINGVPFRTFLFGSKANGHLLLVNKTMQKHAGVTVGKIAEIVVEPDLEDRTAKLPAELAKLFKEDRAVKKWFDALNYSTQRYICDAVEQRKSAESRTRCAEQWVECLMLAMDGEIAVPPVLQMAFRRYPGASDRWATMTPIQRRTQLIAIFQAQSPEARQKRADRTAAEAAGSSGRGSKSKSQDREDDMREWEE